LCSYKLLNTLTNIGTHIITHIQRPVFRHRGPCRTLPTSAVEVMIG